MSSSPTQLTSVGTSGASSPMFRHVPVIGNNHWAVQLSAVSSFDGNAANAVCNDGTTCIAIIDSGTSLIGVPPMGVPLVAKIIKQIKMDCSNLDELPDLVFTLA